MKFKSNAKYNEEPKTGSIFNLKNNSLEISIHKYVNNCDCDTGYPIVYCCLEEESDE